MARVITIYCEGNDDSHDKHILDKICANLPNVRIKPIGGKRGAKAIMEFQESGGLTTQSDFYCLFRDRDFDFRVPAKEKLTFDSKHTYSGYRTTIENYLFDTSLFYQFVIDKHLQAKYNLYSEQDVRASFIAAAKEIQYYQAVRHTLGELRGRTDFETKWVQKDGDLPQNLDLDSCTKEGWKLVEEVLSANNQNWTKDKFDTTLQKFLDLFDNSFFNDLKFLIYFQGKDFAAALQQRLLDFPMKKYYKFTKERFDYTQFTDLVELRQILEIESKK